MLYGVVTAVSVLPQEAVKMSRDATMAMRLRQDEVRVAPGVPRS